MRGGCLTVRLWEHLISQWMRVQSHGEISCAFCTSPPTPTLLGNVPRPLEISQLTCFLYESIPARSQRTLSLPIFHLSWGKTVTDPETCRDDM